MKSRKVLYMALNEKEIANDSSQSQLVLKQNKDSK